MHFKKKDYSNKFLTSFVVVLTVCALIPAIGEAMSKLEPSEAMRYTQYDDGTEKFLVRDYSDEDAQAALKDKREEEARIKVEEEAARLAYEQSLQEAYYEENNNYEDSYDSGYSEDGYYSGGDGVLTQSGGVNYYNGNMETWYSQRVLPGGGLDIPGRHVAEDGTVRDGDGYIVVASDNYGYGSTVETSLGAGKVYDTGVGHDGWDIYVDW